MKANHYLLAMALLFAGTMSMSAHVSHGTEDYDVVKLDTVNKPFRAGQVLVKFKDDSSISLRSASGRVRASSSRVQSIINQLGVTNMEQLMPVAGKIKVQNSSRVRYANGKPIEDRDLSKLYLVEYDAENAVGVREAVNAFKQLDEVEFAEPNYVVYALGSLAPPHTGCSAEPQDGNASRNIHSQRSDVFTAVGTCSHQTARILGHLDPECTRPSSSHCDP
ncbi:MAG: hypothetical protein IJV17_02865 [Prevotella sp.]|nr:hypothetical protein [Prevotella sp.]